MNKITILVVLGLLLVGAWYFGLLSTTTDYNARCYDNCIDTGYVDGGCFLTADKPPNSQITGLYCPLEDGWSVNCYCVYGITTTTSLPSIIPSPTWSEILNILTGKWNSFILSVQNIWDSLFAPLFVVVVEHNVGDTFNMYSSCSTSETIDADYSDGTVRKLYGRWVLLKDGSKIDEGSSWEELSTQTYSRTYEYTCTEDSKIVLATTIYKASNTYSSGSWGSWNVVKVAEDRDAHTCGVPEPPSPISSLEALWNNFIGALQNIWASIFGG